MKDKLKSSPLGIITVCAASVIGVYYFIYVILCLLRVEVMYMSLFGLFVILCVSLPIIFREKLKHILGRAFKVLHIIFAVLLCIYIVSVIFFWVYITFNAAKTPQSYVESYSEQNDTGKDTVVLVFGCYTNGITPGTTLRLRLDAAYEILDALPDAVCIVSGSQGKRESARECDVMRRYLIDRGISEGRIMVEGESHTTSENLRFSMKILDKEGHADKRIIAVSTAFHLPRIELIAKRYGFEVDTCAAPAAGPAYLYVSMVREYLSYIKMLLFDTAVIAR